MINLLPEDNKAEIRAGRLNVIFLNYIIMTALAMAFLGLLFGIAFITLSADRQNAQQRVSENDTSITRYSEVQRQADEYRKNLATAKQLFDKSFNYSTAFVKIANKIPNGVVLTNLSLDPKTIDTPTVLIVNAKNDKTVSEMIRMMQEIPKDPKTPALFSNTSLLSITYNEDKNKEYPVTANISTKINKAGLQ